MFPLNTTLHSVCEVNDSPHAPIGNKFYQLKDAQGFYHTEKYPIGTTLDYRMRIWIRRTSPDSVPSSTFYVGACFWNHLRLHMNYENRGAFYFIDGKEGSSLNESWR